MDAQQGCDARPYDQRLNKDLAYLVDRAASGFAREAKIALFKSGEKGFDFRMEFVGHMATLMHEFLREGTSAPGTLYPTAHQRMAVAIIAYQASSELAHSRQATEIIYKGDPDARNWAEKAKAEREAVENGNQKIEG